MSKSKLSFRLQASHKASGKASGQEILARIIHKSKANIDAVIWIQLLTE